MALSDQEKAAVATAAGNAGLAVGAWIGRTVMDAAEHRSVPVPVLYRELITELTRISDRLSQALTSMPEGQAAAACVQAARDADIAALRLHRILAR